MSGDYTFYTLHSVVIQNKLAEKCPWHLAIKRSFHNGPVYLLFQIFSKFRIDSINRIEWFFSKCQIGRINRIDPLDLLNPIDPLDPIDPTLRKFSFDPILTFLKQL